jgi:hypothetical protein
LIQSSSTLIPFRTSTLMLLPLIPPSDPNIDTFLLHFLLVQMGLYPPCTPCSVSTSTFKLHSLHPKNWSSKLLWSTGILPYNYTAIQPRRHDLNLHCHESPKPCISLLQ